MNPKLIKFYKQGLMGHKVIGLLEVNTQSKGRPHLFVGIAGYQPGKLLVGGIPSSAKGQLVLVRKHYIPPQLN